MNMMKSSPVLISEGSPGVKAVRVHLHKNVIQLQI